jgi:hypothetical protein
MYNLKQFIRVQREKCDSYIGASIYEHFCLILGIEVSSEKADMDEFAKWVTGRAVPSGQSIMSLRIR